jgi:ATP-dependent DNA helicase RecG
MPPVRPSALCDPVTSLRGVGPERAAQLARLGVQTVEDLLLLRPRRYEDRRSFRPIAGLATGEAASVRGRAVALGIKRWRAGTKSVFELILEDGTGRLHCRWWNLPFMQHYFHAGDEVLVYGKPSSLRPRTMDHPETEVVEPGEENCIHLNRVVPVYPLTEGLPQRWLRALIWRALQQYEAHIPESPAQYSQLPPRAQAIHLMHVPQTVAEVELARQRLALDELVALQLEIQRRRNRLRAHAPGLPCGGDNRWVRPFLKQLGFELTAAQTRVLREIRRDLRSGLPMRRLLQGDVGSGKTVVAACAALMTLESGLSVALMAPTEILAEQHFRTFSRWFAPLGLEVALRTGGHRDAAAAASQPSPSERDAAVSAVLTIGTHALIDEGFAPARLGLVIIDEQHKFGVAQREQLVRKGQYPHLLVMTATPIPRTLGLTLYGDLDLSTIDQLPPGRGQVRTYVRRAEHLPKVWAFVRSQLDQGRRAYVVYPRIDGAEGDDLKAVTQEWEQLTRELAPYRVGLLHGRLRAEDKDRVMAEFCAGRTQALVATSVIEVGIDVPQATVMVIENADQFGLAQLHQLRGRIGRGPQKSHCILVASLTTAEARERLHVMEETSDGFRVAEVDLRLRGPGDFLGQHQSGLPPFRFADLATDRALVETARDLARQILDAEPDRP